MKYRIDEKDIRVYHSSDSCVFKKNSDEFGGLSNMATKYPLMINGLLIKTSEALYQACRFPHLPEIQKKIIDERSPMTVKMISNANKANSRPDWDIVRLKIMKWCISVKLAQNFVSFGIVISQTGLNNIVENSAKDNFWGAIPNADCTVFSGQNALGRLLMDLRKKYNSEQRYALLQVKPLQIPNFCLLGEYIRPVDELDNFMLFLAKYKISSYDDKLARGENNNLSEDNCIAKTIHYFPSFDEANASVEGMDSGSKQKSKPSSRKKKIENPDLFINSNL